MVKYFILLISIMLISCNNIFTTTTTTTINIKTKLIKVSGFRGDEMRGESLKPSTKYGTDFGKINSGYSVRRQFTISNIGTDTVHLTKKPEIIGLGYKIEGPDSLDILPNENQKYIITFIPNMVGEYSETLEIGSNATNFQTLSQLIYGECISSGISQYYSINATNVAYVVSYDANDDGYLDILAWEGGNNPFKSILHVFINDGNGNLIDKTSSVLSFDQNFTDGVPTTFRYIDLLNEGKEGILLGVIGFEDSGGPYGGKIHYLYPDGYGKLLDRNDLFGTYWGETEDFDIADIDGDGYNEIYLTQCPGGHYVIDPLILKYSNGAYRVTHDGMTEEMKSGNGYFFSCNFLDIAGKGNSDLFLGFRESYYGEDYITDTIAINNGKGTFALGSRSGIPSTRYSYDWDCPRAYVSDIDNDGIADIVEVLNPHPNEPWKMAVKVFLNRNEGQFDDGSNGLPEYLADYFLYDFSGISDIQLIDSNHDGYIDLLINGNCIKPSLWINNFGSSFTCNHIFQIQGSYPQTVMPGDFNNDGTTDFVLVYNYNPG